MIFSHIYTKMPKKVQEGTEKTAKLLEVLITSKKDLSKEFIEYDTRTIEGDHYKLPEGKLIVLLLLSSSIEWDRGELWTTVRQWTPDKELFYKSLRGTQVPITKPKKNPAGDN